jgi:predicted phage terminase large subunit-like protein
MAGSPVKRARKLEAAAIAAEPVAPPPRDLRYAGLLTHEQVLQMRALPLVDVIRYWDLLEAAGKRQGNLQVVIRGLVLADLFYLMARICHRDDMLHGWVYQRVREVEADPYGHIDLWSRGHFKSSTITFGVTLWDILRDPEVTCGIFSHTRPIAKMFLRQLMRELEDNTALHAAFPDVLWGKDTKQSPKWSEDDGIIVKRRGNPPEATVEAWGLVDGQPTGKHFKRLIYDDVVVEGSVTTPEMIEKTNKGIEQSLNLVNEDFRQRWAGTRWKFNDSYRMVIDRKIALPRVYPCTDDGTEHGEPVFWTKEMMQFKRQAMGPYTFAAQCLLDPTADALQGFRREWLRHYRELTESQWQRMSRYILVDSANAKRKDSDYTSMWVIGLAQDQNYYVISMVRDRLTLSERTERVFSLHKKYRPQFPVRWERYGMMADIQHIKTEQERLNYRFEIVEVGGNTPKNDRIGRLLPIFEQHRIYLPETHYITDYQKISRDLVQVFIEEEYMQFPATGGHEDMLDSLARIAEPDMALVWPKEAVPSGPRTIKNPMGAGAWMA